MVGLDDPVGLFQPWWFSDSTQVNPNPLHISLWALLVLGGSRTCILRGNTVGTRLHFCVSGLHSDGGRGNFWLRQRNRLTYFFLSFFFLGGGGGGGGRWWIGGSEFPCLREVWLSAPCKRVFSEAVQGRDSCSFCTQVLVNSQQITSRLFSKGTERMKMWVQEGCEWH